MAINSFLHRPLGGPLLATALSLAAVGTAAPPVWSREAASASACQAAAAKPAIVDARSALDSSPDDLEASFELADAWSDAGCFNDSVQVLEAAEGVHSGNKELETRLRVAYSLVGEEHFFDNLDRATAEARLKRQSFRCNTLSDLDACNDALRLKPDDPSLLVAQGDALLRAKRPADAANRYRLAAVIAPNQHDVTAKIAAAESQLQDPSASNPPAASAAAGLGPGPGTAADDVAAARPTGTGMARATSGDTPPAPAQTAQLTATHASTHNAGAAKATVHRYSNAAPDAQSH